MYCVCILSHSYTKYLVCFYKLSFVSLTASGCWIFEIPLTWSDSQMHFFREEMSVAYEMSPSYSANYSSIRFTGIFV